MRYGGHCLFAHQLELAFAWKFVENTLELEKQQ